MDFAEVVGCHKQADCGPVVVQFARPAKTEPGKPFIEVPD